MGTAPPLPLAIEHNPHYVANMAAVMFHKEMPSTLTQVAQRAFKSQEQVTQLTQQLQELVVTQQPLLTQAFKMP